VGFVTESVPTRGTAPGGHTTPPAAAVADLASLRAELQGLVDGVHAAEAAHADQLAAVRPVHRESAANLIHYVWLRGRDVRGLQGRLADLGLSSLGRLESRVLPTLASILAALDRIDGHRSAATPDMHTGPDRLERNARNLLGAGPKDRVSRIMVTFPSEAAIDPDLVRDMIAAGMDIVRVNCAHDGPGEWAAMIGHLRAAQGLAPDGPDHGTDTGPARYSRGGETAPERCLVAMDLAGPKLRTGPIAPGPRVVKAKPRRSATGQVLVPAAVALVLDPRAGDGAGTVPDDHVAPERGDSTPPPGRPPAGAATGHRPAVQVAVTGAEWLAERAVGERIRFTDARGSDRTLVVTARRPDRVDCSMDRTAYFVPGVVLTAPGGQSTDVGHLPPTEQHLVLRAGDRLVVTRSLEPVHPLTEGTPRIGCTLAQVFEDAEPGQRILFDDGKIGGTITSTGAGQLEVRIDMAGPDGTKLRAGKGINLPDTRLDMPALTADDLAALPFVVEHADMVNLSFVRTPADVGDLLDRVTELGRDDLDVVVKIETLEAFENLPQILLEAMRWPDIGVMIARGDLAVEVGFERLAEVQEEILWLCEAAHVPVIWATQVLDSLARTGLPSRAEVTDAAMAERAECVMLNKGPYVVEAIGFLAGVLGRMQGHVSKKRTLLRQLRSWTLGAEGGAGVTTEGQVGGQAHAPAGDPGG
jgi:pyruvate kinase